MISTRLKMTACALAALTMSACSSADLEMFNAGLEMYNGVTYYDQTHPNETLECGSGNGYLLLHNGVRNNQQYVYITNRAPIAVTVTLKDAAGGGQSLYSEPGGVSETYWTYPSYGFEFEWRC